jgi:phage-related tail fiber protein
MPVGAVVPFSSSAVPPTWLFANGQEVSRTEYAELFALFGSPASSGNGVTTFNVPDLRGEFIRGWDGGRGVDGGRTFGSAQNGQMQSHFHGTGAFNSEGNDDWLAILKSGWTGTYNGRLLAGNYNGNIQGSVNGGTGGTVFTGTTPEVLNSQSETRPRNVALMYCIKAKRNF